MLRSGEYKNRFDYKRAFFNYHGPFALMEIVSRLECRIEHDNMDVANIVVYDAVSLKDALGSDVAFLHNSQYADQLFTTKAIACIVSEGMLSDLKNRDGFAEKIPNLLKQMVFLVVDDAYYAYSRLVSMMFSEKIYNGMNEIHEYENDGIIIGQNVTIEDGVIIGDGTVIGHGAVIKNGVKIGKNCRIGANTVVNYTHIGDNVSIGHGGVIGGDGFGFATYKGVHHKILHIGIVIIHDNVDIGNGVTIDRGSGSNTVIGAGTFIDNIVQIGHNVTIGKGCIIVSLVGIAGSVVIEDYVAIGGQAGIAGHLRIGSGAQIAGHSGVINDVENGAIVGGYPAIPIRDWHRQSVMLKNMVGVQAIDH